MTKTNIYNIIKDESFSEERALYSLKNTEINNCRFEGELDGESALKECDNIYITKSYFDLRYPLWHCNVCNLDQIEMTINARAAIWYTSNISIIDSKILAPKVIRESQNIYINNSIIESDESFWKNNCINIKDTLLSGKYAFFLSNNLKINNLKFSGKYSFQYVKDVKITNSIMDTKDAFWHADNVVCENSVLKGEYLGWYSNNLTLINCKIIGTQPLCYCKNLNIIDCSFEDCDLAFENSEVNAKIIGKITSIKNPLKGNIYLEDGLIINDEQNKYNGKVNIIFVKGER